MRQAILDSNGAAGANTINFNIPGSGVQRIQPLTELDQITNPVLIDGYSQPGASVNTLAQGDNAVLLIEINGNNYITGDGQVTGNGLYFVDGSAGSTVRGLIINEWILSGINVDGTSGAGLTDDITIVGNFIGTNSDATAQDANGCAIYTSANGTIIGTPALADRNILAGSFGFRNIDFDFIARGACIGLVGAGETDSTNHVVQNNYIGVDRTGTVALGNSMLGIYSLFADGLQIGGTDESMRNIISGHLIFGVRIRDTTTSNVQGNYVGTDITGTVALGNGNYGVELDAASTDNLIGGSVPGAGNLISGNGCGLRVGLASREGTNNNTIQGNLIGTDVSGKKVIPNQRFGIEVGDSDNTFGGSTALERNIISGNVEGGILIYSAVTTNTIVTGNYIGTDITGTKALPNRGPGIKIGLGGAFGGSSNNTIGS